ATIAGADGSEWLRRQVASTGLKALALYLPPSSAAPAAGSSLPAACEVGDVVAILRACQTAEDEAAVLKDLCGRIRTQVHAAAVAVLIDGESGSGKELVARAVHRLGARRDRAFSTLNCAALPDDLVEAELFGHARGSFTGALSERAGVFEEAHGGTLFLDEIGELSARAPAKLLRVIQDGDLRRIGENISRRVDVRVISATNR